MGIKQKNILLLIGFVAMLVIIYAMSISKTVQLRNDFKVMRTDTRIYDNLPQRLTVLNLKEKYYDSLLVANKIDGSSLQNNLLKTINRYAEKENIIIEGISDPHSSKADDRTLRTYQFEVSGDFQSILGLVYELEQRSKFGKVASMSFEKITSYRTRESKLFGRFTLQLVQ